MDETRLLDMLEAREDPLLCWGIVDGGFSDSELEDLIERALTETNALDVVEDVIESLEAKGLIVRDASVDPPRWRTRNGETLRLLARLRQIFLHDNPAAAWRQAPALVADFRYARRPRAYPRRDRSWKEILEGVGNSNDVHLEVLSAMTSAGEAHFPLAGFQVRAARQILGALQSNATTATVVGAGTGSGKSLAFYLPAFSYLAGLRDSSLWTRALAVYPRNELLKDQLANAFATARRLDPLWIQSSGRPMTLGVLNKDTPHTATALRASYSKWTKQSKGYRCPHFSCPGDGAVVCGGDLHWPEADARAERERLVCVVCARVFDSSMVVLTRKAMNQKPPDLLFTTTEGLNRGLSNLSLRKVFGVGATKKPRLMLLDEIHTYDGAPGAQAAMVLRRWHHSLRSPVTYVGLSATLSNAIRHFADLTGVDGELVTSIEPGHEEMSYEGAEYLIALRSDPTSGASVLSTTIQTAMLLPRVLDSPAARISEGVLGTKTFVFTDDLDVTNRFYSYFLDAEGQQFHQGRATQVKPALASMRRPTAGDLVEQRRAGQVWDLPFHLGHKLDGKGLAVGRTTSQDAGVDVTSQLVVATASLEVGFDDPDVGAVLQHKAPRGVAAFLQRRGRAGRQRGMRPYTAVVLSDYGRDRTAYAAWDSLFDPVIPELVLPIRNRAVLRMQAALSMLDWLAEQVRNTQPWADLWRDLKGRSDPKYPKGRETQNAATAILEQVLRDPARQRSLRQWIEGALQVPEAVANEILWHPPRALVLAAVPTLARRLTSEWAVADPQGFAPGRDLTGGNPLPDYFPVNLFSELALPEGEVVVPPQLERETEPELQPMAMAQMLREYAPGRVSRRFATRNLDHRHWIPVPLDTQDGVLDVATFVPAYLRQETCTLDIDGAATRLPVVRPDRLRVDLPPSEIKDSSNAYLTWRSQFVESGPGLTTRIPSADPVGQHIVETRFFLHAQNSHVEARRVAIESNAGLLLDGGVEHRVRSRFHLDGEPVGLGAAYDVDGLRLIVNLPAQFDLSADIAPGIRSAWFRHLVTTDPVLLESVNSFQLDWLHQAVECMLLTTAVVEKTDLAGAYAAVRLWFADRLGETVAAMFRGVGVGVDEGEATTVGRLQKRLESLLTDHSVVGRLDELAVQFWSPDANQLQQWLRQRALTTFGQAALWAAREICPEHDPDSIVVDIEPGLDGDGIPRTGQVWLTEVSIGGGGFVEALASRVRPDPRRFLRLIMRATLPSSSELVDVHMRRLVHLINNDEDWIQLVAGFRGSPTQEARVLNLDRIREKLRDAGIYGAEQAVVSCLANRLLRPGSMAATDAALLDLVDRWRSEEQRLGVEIPPRTWAYLMRQRSELDSGLRLTHGAADRQRIDAIESLLWPRGWKLRADELQSYNPYAENLPAAPDLLRRLLANETPPIDVTLDDADTLIRAQLAERGSAHLSARPDSAAVLAAQLVDLTTRAISTDFLQVFPRVVEVDHAADGTVLVALQLAEVSI
ncbi:protein DpdJ [Kribbella sp. NPDC051718]|uniref:protein DpdJ n=1 Tax=Kribbella sp. NPDC051718 TaxID=3155168 RepID=UPI003430F47D